MKLVFLVVTLAMVSGSTEDICCVCVPLSLCKDRVLTAQAQKLVGSTQQQIRDTNRPTNVQSCRRKFLTCCQVPTLPQTCLKETPIQFPVASVPESPWIGFIELKHQNRIVGSATLIHPKVLLTSANIVQNLQSTDLLVSMGNQSISRSFNRYKNMKVKSLLIHPAFRPHSLKNDLALLVLEDTVQNSREYRPIALARGRKHFDTDSCFATGLRNVVESGEPRAVTKTIPFRLIARKRCVKSLRKLTTPFALKPGVECATANDPVLCDMFDGVSVSCKKKKTNGYAHFGVVAKTFSCDNEDIPNVVTTIPRQLRWIKRELRKRFPRNSKRNRKQTNNKNTQIRFKS